MLEAYLGGKRLQAVTQAVMHEVEEELEEGHALRREERALIGLLEKNLLGARA